MGWHDEDPLTFRNIGERDVDFLLLEELRCSDAFREWFVSGATKALGLASLPESGSVFHSVHRTGVSTGETDILVEFDRTGVRGSGQYAILIEDKIDAAFSDRTKCGSPQTERYRSEIAKRVAKRDWIAGAVILVAPRDYLAAVDPTPFDAVVSYEQIREWFEAEARRVTSHLAFRYEHKRQMLSAAILRLRRGWERQGDLQVGGIWGYYHSIASAEFADLRMSYKGDEPSDSYSVYFKCLPRVEGIGAARLAHVMERGTVDVLVPDRAERLALFTQALGSALGPRMTLRKAGKAIGVNLRVPLINRFSDPKSQTDAIRAGLVAARTLKNWYEVNARLFLAH